jgi:hypothetical protein
MPWRRMRSGGIAPPYLTSALDGGESSASRPGRFTSWKTPSGTHWIGGWVGPRAGWTLWRRQKISCPCRESNPDSSVIQPARNISEQRRTAERNWFSTSGRNSICLSRLEFKWLLPKNSSRTSYTTARVSCHFRWRTRQQTQKHVAIVPTRSNGQLNLTLCRFTIHFNIILPSMLSSFPTGSGMFLATLKHATFPAHVIFLVWSP